jgi:hypothetical protein
MSQDTGSTIYQSPDLPPPCVRIRPTGPGRRPAHAASAAAGRWSGRSGRGGATGPRPAPHAWARLPRKPGGALNYPAGFLGTSRNCRSAAGRRGSRPRAAVRNACAAPARRRGAARRRRAPAARPARARPLRETDHGRAAAAVQPRSTASSCWSESEIGVFEIGSMDGGSRTCDGWAPYDALVIYESTLSPVGSSDGAFFSSGGGLALGFVSLDRPHRVGMES